MNYKKMALVLLLVPMMSCASVTIENLLKEQSEKERNIALLYKQIQEETDLLIAYKTAAYSKCPFLTLPSTLDEYINSSMKTYETGRDVIFFIEQNQLLGQDNLFKDYLTLRMVIQSRHIARLIIQSRSLISELVLLNKKINDQKGSK